MNLDSQSLGSFPTSGKLDLFEFLRYFSFSNGGEMGVQCPSSLFFGLGCHVFIILIIKNSKEE